MIASAEIRAEARAILLRAIDLIEREGWCQNANRYFGQRCAGAAVYDAAGLSGCRDPELTTAFGVYVSAARALRMRISPAYLYVQEWNDAPGRTRDEVIAALRAAADSLLTETPC